MSEYNRLMRIARELDAKGLNQDAQTFYDRAQKSIPELKDEAVRLQDGKPVLVRNYKDGTTEVSPFQPTADTEWLDLGGAKVPVDKRTNAMGAALRKSMTPGESASNALGWANYRKPQMADGPNGPVFVTAPAGMPPGASFETGIGPKMPDSQKKELQNLDAQRATVASAIKSVQDTPSAFSAARGAATLGGTVAESVAGRFDSEDERKTRAFVFNIVSKVINERAGAAQSKQELARLRSFLPGEMDSAKQIEDKLAGYDEYLKEQRSVYAAPVGQPPGGPSPGRTIDFNSLPKVRR